MIADRLNAYLESITGVEIPDEIIERVAIQVARTTRRNFGDARSSDGNALRLSAVGKCPRAGWYLHHNEKAEPLPARTRLVFGFGDVIEAQLIALITLSGIKVLAVNKEVNLNVMDVPLKGHIDLVVEIDGKPVIVEIKSMSRRGFEEAKIHGIPGNDFGYLDQIQAYMRAEQTDRAIFLCASKEQGHLAEYEVGRADETFVPRAEAYVKGVLGSGVPDQPYAAIDEIVSFQGKVQAGIAAEKHPEYVPLDRKGAWYPFKTGRKSLGKTCGYCGFKSICWQGLTMVMDNDKPRWLVPS